ncbi:hypothetical protein [Winogradskyella alexanderae]|uniref:Uncharacterized protein n=1 Tax=Winogradskyella alexanderae TaxID=2877123 RepID=A0ABS7XU18_9FLAO|nr:hypothetical protein [Winogradskyella alexanderae]MCA0133518.1 hypothetical protein [Winogradskyella alexanderae]
MKKITFTLIALVGFNLIFAQNKSKEEVLELMANDTCECIQKKKIDPSDSMEQKQMALGLCLITSYNEHKSKSKYFSKQKTTDFEKIGEEVGMVMATICVDDFMSIFSSEELVGFIDDEDDMEGSRDVESNLSIEVELISMRNDAISYIETKDDFDKNHIFLITQEFEGYELLKKSNFGKSYKVTFKEEEYFDLSERQYIIKKVITKIEQL